MKAVIDRYESDYAIVLFGAKEIEVDIPIKLLPKETKEGSWLIINIELDSEGEKQQRSKIQNKLDKLKNKSRDENGKNR